MLQFAFGLVPFAFCHCILQFAFRVLQATTLFQARYGRLLIGMSVQTPQETTTRVVKLVPVRSPDAFGFGVLPANAVR
jgi:hypothetical protein